MTFSRKTFVAAALLAPLCLAADAGAEYLNGSISLGADTTPNNDDVTLATVFSFSTPESGANTQRVFDGTGDFASVPNNAIVTATDLDLSNPTAFLLDYMGNTFAGSSFVAITMDMSTHTKSVLLDGTITPVGGFQPTEAILTFSFNQSGGAGNAVGYGASLATVAVPEPSTAALAGLGALGVVGLSRRRRRTAR